MKLFAIAGGTATERTAAAKRIAAELERRHQTTALWLEPQGEATKQDSHQPSKTICGNTITFAKTMDLEEYLQYITEEYVIADSPLSILPRFAIDGTKDELTFGSAEDFTDFGEMVDFIEKAAPEKMPFINGTPCCKGCSYASCADMLSAIIKGEATINDCGVADQSVHVKINGFELTLVEFGQNIVRGTNQGLLSTLNGYQENAHIEIEILPQAKK